MEGVLAMMVFTHMKNLQKVSLLNLYLTLQDANDAARAKFIKHCDYGEDAKPIETIGPGGELKIVFDEPDNEITKVWVTRSKLVSSLDVKSVEKNLTCIGCD